MIRKPVVFSLMHEQSSFMTMLIAVLTFLAVVTLGIALAIGNGVIKWNAQWETHATIQTLNDAKNESIEKILKENSDKIQSVTKISDSDMKSLMRPWVSGNSGLQNYLPNMWEVEFKSASDMTDVGNTIAEHARFMKHSDALRAPMSTGWKLVSLSGFVLLVILGSIGLCILYTAQNTAMLHKRELEILNQIGATDSFIARQMQIIVGKIALYACGIGFISAMPIILLVLGIAHGARSGLMSMMTLSVFGWVMLILLPILISIFAVLITKRATINILKHS